MAMSDTQRQLLCMALALEGDALPKTDVCIKSPEASEKPLLLGAVTISILYKINFALLGKPGTAQFPTGQGNSEFLLPLSSSACSADPVQARWPKAMMTG